MRSVVFKPEALKQFENWVLSDEKTQKKTMLLIEACLQESFSGIGKPEALKHTLKGCWSRRITKEQRLVYQVTKQSIIVISCKIHY